MPAKLTGRTRGSDRLDKFLLRHLPGALASHMAIRRPGRCRANVPRNRTPAALISVVSTHAFPYLITPVTFRALHIDNTFIVISERDFVRREEGMQLCEVGVKQCVGAPVGAVQWCAYACVACVACVWEALSRSGGAHKAATHVIMAGTRPSLPRGQVSPPRKARSAVRPAGVVK